MGRPPYKPTKEHRELVRSAAIAGIPAEHVAAALDISPTTLRKHFRKDLDGAMLQANAKVAGTLFRMATSGRSPAATIFWAKSRLRWRETIQVAGPDGKELKVAVTHDIASAISKHLDAIRSFARGSGAEPGELVSGPIAPAGSREAGTPEAGSGQA